MANKFVNKDQKKKEKKRKEKKRNNTFVQSILQVVNGDILTRQFVIRNLPFISFLSLVLVIYIGYGYHTQKVAKDIRTFEKEILELNAEEVTLKSDLNKLSRQKRVAEKLKQRGLSESHEPLKIIDVNDGE